jgi:NADH-ubiquinone oxidoreductase chain 2
MGIPPLVGFFGKQMVLSAALDKGLIFLSIVAILTSVIGGVYYLNIIRQIFFYSPEYKINPLIQNLDINANIYDNNNKFIKTTKFKYNNITLSSPMAFSVSTITLIILFFIFFNNE